MIDNSNKRVMLSIIGVAVLLIAVVGVTYSFFNYTRVGAINNIGTGRIYFTSSQSGTLNVTNVFPIKESELDPSTLDEVTINIQGDTTYESGEEYLISLTELNNTINAKNIPLNYIATVSNVGTSSDTYWESRGGNSSIYTLNALGHVEEDKTVLVGYIKSGETGINGNIKIKAYVDADRIAISDTYHPEHPETDTYGTTNEWVNTRTVLTTEEWDSFQTNSSLSFKIKVESNEGVWVEEPVSGTIESCTDCKFLYTTNTMYTTWNAYSQTPTVLQDGLSDNFEEVVAVSGKNYFLGLKLNDSNQITDAYACGIKDRIPFCIKGSSDHSELSNNINILQSANLWNNTCDFRLENNGYISCGSWNDNDTMSADDNENYVRTGNLSTRFCFVTNYGIITCIG